MTILIILKDIPFRRSTFIYARLDGQKTIVHFSPEFHLEGLTLGETYEKKGLVGVQTFYKNELGLDPQEFIELSLEEMGELTNELAPNGLHVEVPDSGREYLLQGEAVAEAMRYRLNDTNEFEVFRIQQKILKSFLKTLGKKRNVLRVPRLLKKYPNAIQTSIQLPQVLSILHKFLQAQQNPSQKLAFPLKDTFQVVQRAAGKKVIVIDFSSNRNELRHLAHPSVK